MNIWVIGRSYPESNNNMMGSFELEQAMMLQKRGNTVQYLSTQLKHNKSIKIRGYKYWQEGDIGIHTYSNVFLPRINHFFLPQIRKFYLKKLLHKVLEKTGKPDVIHLHFPAMLMMADVLREYHKMGVKIIVTEHWTKVLVGNLDNIELKELKKYFDYIGACICVSTPLADRIKNLVKNSEKNIRIIPNVVEQEFKPTYTKHEGFEFIAVGRLVKVKQFEQIITAFTKCFRGDSVRLTIVGGGIEFNSLSKLVTDFSMESQIVLTGNLSRSGVAERVSNSDCLICYSRLETFGVPIVEAWACGIPAVFTTAAAVIDTYDERLGVEISPDNIDELINALLYVYSNKNIYNKKYISTYAYERFSEDTIYKKLMSVYQEKE